jgi:hypothetical protein
VLLGGEPGERLKPVGVVAGSILDGPIFHRCGYDVCDGGIERLAPIYSPEQAAVDFLGEPLAHHAAGENVAAEDGIDPLFGHATAVE